MLLGSAHNHDNTTNKDIKEVEEERQPLEDPTTNVEAEPLEDPTYVVGSKCRFRHSNGRWYNGQIVDIDGSSSAKISFLTPTSENMLVKVKLHFFNPLYAFTMSQYHFFHQWVVYQSFVLFILLHFLEIFRHLYDLFF